MTDLILTWPKSRSLQDYLEQLQRAHIRGQVINFKVSNRPKVEAGARCYMVHDGHIRGYSEILSIEERGENEVEDTQNPGKYWPAGIYVVRSPKWVHTPPEPMAGFRGFRYRER